MNVEINPPQRMRQIQAAELTGAVITAMLEGTDVVRKRLTDTLGYSRNTLKYAELDRSHVRLTRARADAFLKAMGSKGVTAFIDQNETLPIRERAVTVVAYRVLNIDLRVQPNLRRMAARTL